MREEMFSIFTLSLSVEYAKGGAEYIKEIRETPETENFFDNEDDFRDALLDR